MGEGTRFSGDAISRKKGETIRAFQPVRVETKFFGERMIESKKLRVGDACWVLFFVEALREAGVAVIEGNFHGYFLIDFAISAASWSTSSLCAETSAS